MTNNSIQPAALQDRSRWRGLLYVAVLVVVCGVLFAPGSAQLPLTDPDETRCALIVQDMLQNGNWIVPHLEGDLYVDKPAPYFWLAAAGQVLTGDIG